MTARFYKLSTGTIINVDHISSLGWATYCWTSDTGGQYSEARKAAYMGERREFLTDEEAAELESLMLDDDKHTTWKNRRRGEKA